MHACAQQHVSASVKALQGIDGMIIGTGGQPLRPTTSDVGLGPSSRAGADVHSNAGLLHPDPLTQVPSSPVLSLPAVLWAVSLSVPTGGSPGRLGTAPGGRLPHFCWLQQSWGSDIYPEAVDAVVL